MLGIEGPGGGGELSQVTGATHSHMHTHTFTLTDTHLSWPSPMYIYGDTHTHPQLPIGWPSPPSSSILNSQARQPLAERSGNPPGSGGAGAGPGGGGEWGSRDICSPCIFHKQEMESWGRGGAGARARAGSQMNPLSLSHQRRQGQRPLASQVKPWSHPESQLDYASPFHCLLFPGKKAPQGTNREV